MKFQIKKRFVLIIATSVAQLLCLCWGVFFFDHWLQDSIRTTMTKQVLADNVETARQMTRLIEEAEITDVDHNLQSWGRLQSIIKDIRLPNEGYVCVVSNSDGQLLCHPLLDTHPLLTTPEESGNVKSMITKKPMMATKEMPSTDSPGSEMARKKALMMKQAAMAKQNQMAQQKLRMVTKEPMTKPEASEITSGKLTVDGRVQIVAAATIPAMDAKVLVHQRASGIEAAINRISLPVRTIGLSVAIALALVSLIINAFILHRYENKLASLNEELEDLNDDLEDLVKERTQSLVNTRNSVIFGLAKLAESRDSDTGEHLERIRLYVVDLAKQLSRHNDTLSPSYIENLGLASSLHDIGKVGIPDQVLLKPGRLDPTEREVIEHHPQIGGDCLQAISEQLGDDDFLEISREIAYAHHERWDGQGYPFHIAGEKIPLSARIVALADVYDALRSKRPYKEPMSHDKAREIIIQGRGSHFDPVIVDAFLACEERFEGISDFYQDIASDRANPQAIVAELATKLNNQQSELALT